MNNLSTCAGYRVFPDFSSYQAINLAYVAGGSTLIKIGLGSSRKGHLRQLWNAIGYPPLNAQRDPWGIDKHLDPHDRDAGFPPADRVDRFAYQVRGHPVFWPVDIEVEIADELGPVRVADLRR